MGVHLSANLGKKSVLFLLKTYFFFFGLHLKSGRKSVLFLKKTFLFFWSSPEFGEKKCSISIFLLVFTKFQHLNKIVVEVHPPNVENMAKLQIIPPQCSTKIGTTDSSKTSRFENHAMQNRIFLCNLCSNTHSMSLLNYAKI